jgi:transcriptional regulator with XRE-family HTH domain
MTAAALTAALQILGWSGNELGRRLGVHRNTVSAWATGRVAVPGYVAEYLRVMLLAKEALSG